MGRKKGGKNCGNFTNEVKQPIPITSNELTSLPEVFTSIEKDFISIQDIQTTSGLSYDKAAQIIREIKSVSDIFSISGYIHRTDYFLYLSRRFACIQANAGGGGNDI